MSEFEKAIKSNNVHTLEKLLLFEHVDYDSKCKAVDAKIFELCCLKASLKLESVLDREDKIYILDTIEKVQAVISILEKDMDEMME